MPPPVELSGQRFGRLLVLGRAPHMNGRTAWLCRCDCGQDTTVLTQRLCSARDDNPRAVRACETCRSRACQECGKLYLRPGSTATCGNPSCRLSHRQIVNAVHEALTEIDAPGAKTRRQRAYRAHIRAERPEVHAANLAADAARARAARARRSDGGE